MLSHLESHFRAALLGNQWRPTDIAYGVGGQTAWRAGAAELRGHLDSGLPELHDFHTWEVLVWMFLGLLFWAGLID